MNDVKPIKLNQFFKLNLPQGVCIGIIIIIITKLIEKYGDKKLMESLFQTFFIELWPIWFGIIGFLMYLALREVISIHKFIKIGLKFDERLDELGVERRELMTHVHNSYNDLSSRLGKIENGVSQDS